MAHVVTPPRRPPQRLPSPPLASRRSAPPLSAAPPLAQSMAQRPAPRRPPQGPQPPRMPAANPLRPIPNQPRTRLRLGRRWALQQAARGPWRRPPAARSSGTPLQALCRTAFVRTACCRLATHPTLAPAAACRWNLRCASRLHRPEYHPGYIGQTAILVAEATANQQHLIVTCRTLTRSCLHGTSSKLINNTRVLHRAALRGGGAARIPSGRTCGWHGTSAARSAASRTCSAVSFCPHSDPHLSLQGAVFSFDANP